MLAVAPVILPGNAQSQGDRDYQEDAFGFSGRNDAAFVRHAGVAAVLCDGMGGLQFGAESATLAVDTFLGEYRRKLPTESPGEALRRSALRANDAVYRFARDNGIVRRTGCTLVAVAARGVELHCIHAGDSRAYLYSGGVLQRLTNDHTYARRLDLQVEQGQISSADAMEHPNRDHLTSNLGREELPELDLLDPPKKLAPNDWVVLCSDGLHGVLTDDEIGAELHGSSQDAAQRLVTRVTERGVPDKDNVTVVILQVGADGALSTTRESWHTGKRREPGLRAASAAAMESPKARKAPGSRAPASAAPKWIWGLAAVPLVLAAAAWMLWPTRPAAPAGPVTSGIASPPTPATDPAPKADAPETVPLQPKEPPAVRKGERAAPAVTSVPRKPNEKDAATGNAKAPSGDAKGEKKEKASGQGSVTKTPEASGKGPAESPVKTDKPEEPKKPEGPAVPSNGAATANKPVAPQPPPATATENGGSPVP